MLMLSVKIPQMSIWRVNVSRLGCICYLVEVPDSLDLLSTIYVAAVATVR